MEWDRMTQYQELPGARPVADAPELSVLPFRRPVAPPLTAEFRLGGWSYRITVWTAEAWAAVPESGRPPNAGALGGGAWFLITPGGD